MAGKSNAEQEFTTESTERTERGLKSTNQSRVP